MYALSHLSTKLESLRAICPLLIEQVKVHTDNLAYQLPFQY